MADLEAYPANVVPQNAIIVRQHAGIDHAVVRYNAEDLSRPLQGPANPFKNDSESLKRKNILTGYAEETFISEFAFRSKLREMERGPGREYRGGVAEKEESARIKSKRQKKGDATVAEGDNAYIGPWAKYKSTQYEEVEEHEQLLSGEEYEEISEEDEEFIKSGTVVSALPQAIAKRKEAEEMGEETSIFEGSQQFDYQGRTYMHVPQDLDIDLRSERTLKEIKNYVPKKMVHQWKSHVKPICGLRFFPDSGHLLLSGSVDTTVKIWDVYHDRELLRTYKGHNKALSDITFNPTGTQFLSASYDRMIKLWDTETGQCINRFTTGKTPHVIRFNPSPEYCHEFLAGMSDKKIVQFDTRTREVVQEYDHHLAAINTITFVDENRRFMTTSDDKSLRAWDYNIPVPIKYIAEPHMYPLTRASLHPSGKYVAYQSSDNNIFVYGANDKFRQNRKKAFKGHNTSGYAIDVACSPDGQFVSSGDSGGYVCFWDWKTGKMWHKLQAAEGAVTCVAWHPRETSKVVTAGLEGTIRYWD
ncbi:Pre-mRNA-processing factor 17 [Erysiphe necator]|uniref:Putative pre-mrna-processing factor 17 n=1 Tax=Uncinula necator TaxID=52586 RepID=A0A0B1PDJ7_UNCNE|nr:Pre-mRNA-processing factor 17 [Erysiphe necator]KHJ35430.1 putative pre-mrna-processing factor 17 [Erysiphe necator]